MSVNGFSNKIALVTGGSSGIGLETAVALSRSGSHVWLMARGRSQLEAALTRIQQAQASSSQKCGIVVADVTCHQEVARAVDRLVEENGPPDLLINCAGDVYLGLFHEADMGAVRSLTEVNYLGTLNVTRACLPAMVDRGSGHIVNLSSVYGYLGGYGYAAYSGSKFAVRGFSDALRAELRPLGIGVSVVFPQNTATPQLERENRLKSATIKAIDNTRVMQPETVAKAILRGIARRQYVIIPGGEGRFLFWLTGILGTGTYRIVDHVVTRALKRSCGRPEN